MTTFQEVSGSFQHASGVSSAWKTLTAEITALARALVSPGKIIGEVEQMHALRQQADRLQASDPAGAEALRRRAARLGLQR